MRSQEENMALQDRMIRAFRGEVALFEEVEHDANATVEALIVVAIASVSLGIGSALGAAAMGRPSAGVVGLVVGVINALVGWAVFSGVAYFIGTKLFHADATWEEVLRTLGYAYSPMVVGIVAVIPILGGLIVLIAALWTLYLSFVAIRSALDVDTGKTIGTILLSIIPAAIIAALINLPLAALTRA
jgi:hypothetical protein